MVAKRTFHQEHVRHTFLAVSLVDQRALRVMRATRCMFWSLYVHQDDTCTRFAHVCLFAAFVISSAPTPSGRRGPADRYDGAHQIATDRSIGERRGATFRALCQLGRRTVCRFTMFTSIGSSGGVSADRSRSVSPIFTALASSISLSPGNFTCACIFDTLGAGPSQQVQ